MNKDNAVYKIEQIRAELNKCLQDNIKLKEAKVKLMHKTEMLQNKVDILTRKL
jgi:hypothetical protein